MFFIEVLPTGFLRDAMRQRAGAATHAAVASDVPTRVAAWQQRVHTRNKDLCRPRGPAGRSWDQNGYSVTHECCRNAPVAQRGLQTRAQAGRSQRAASGGTSTRLTRVEETSPPRITIAIGPS